MKVVLAASRDELEDLGPGAIYLWNYGKNDKPGYIMMNCPGCGESSAIFVYAPGDKHPADQEAWQITGIPANITLKPSINCVGCCRWHGYLTNGEYKRC
jgi:hypothetical protein